MPFPPYPPSHPHSPHSSRAAANRPSPFSAWHPPPPSPFSCQRLTHTHSSHSSARRHPLGHIPTRHPPILLLLSATPEKHSRLTAIGLLLRMTNPSARIIMNRVNFLQRIFSISSACLMAMDKRRELTDGSMRTRSCSLRETMRGWSRTSGDALFTVSFDVHRVPSYLSALTVIARGGKRTQLPLRACCASLQLGKRSSPE